MRLSSPTTSLLFTTLLTLPYNVLSEADGLIVPFTSTLPACAAQCGPLYDAQGACTPPVLAATSDSCFCAYSTLQPFLTTTAGVCDNACTTDANGLTEIRNWFLSFCGDATATTTSSAGSTATATSGSSSESSSSGHKSWISTHYKWVIMLIVLFLAMVFGWIGASMLHKRIVRKREREFEMRPPVAWGPHQLQGMTGGYNNGHGGVGAAAAPPAVGALNEKMPPAAAPVGEKGEKNKNWLKKSRV